MYAQDQAAVFVEQAELVVDDDLRDDAARGHLDGQHEHHDRLRPRKRYRVRAVHAKNATIIDRTIERCMGQNTGVVVMISSRGFTAVIIIQ